MRYTNHPFARHSNQGAASSRFFPSRFQHSLLSRAQVFSRPILLCCALLLAFVSTACFESKIETLKVQSGGTGGTTATKMNGVFYALPRTVVKVDVPVNRVDKKPGKFVRWTPCFFPDTPPGQIIQAPSTEFEIDSEKVRFDTLPVPDASQIYLIKTQGGRFETRNLELALTESGVFVKGTAENTNNTIDIVTGAIKTFAGVASKLIVPVGADFAGADFRDQLTASQRICFQPLEDAFATAVENAIASGGITPSELRVESAALNTQSQREQKAREVVNSYFQDDQATTGLVRNKAKTDVALAKAIQDIKEFQEAKEVYDKIVALQGQREGLLNPTALQASVPADTLKIMIDELDKTIKNYRETFFLGTKSPLTWNAAFRLNPDSPGKMMIDLFTLSESYGVCDILVNQSPSNQGIQFDPRFLIKKACPAVKPICVESEKVPVACNGRRVWLEMALGENGEGGPGGATFAETVRTASLSQTGKRGFYYRIPGRAIATLFQEGDAAGTKNEMGRAALSIAQFGETVSLPSSTGGRRTKYELALYESSGGMKNFIMGSDALIQKSNVEDVGAAASTIIEARAERKKARAPADELEELERQRKILEERKKIRDLEDDLSSPETPAGNP